MLGRVRDEVGEDESGAGVAAHPEAASQQPEQSGTGRLSKGRALHLGGRRRGQPVDWLAAVRREPHVARLVPDHGRDRGQDDGQEPDTEDRVGDPRQPKDVVSDIASGMTRSWPAAIAPPTSPMARPRRSSNHRVATTAATAGRGAPGPNRHDDANGRVQLPETDDQRRAENPDPEKNAPRTR